MVKGKFSLKGRGLSNNEWTKGEIRVQAKTG